MQTKSVQQESKNNAARAHVQGPPVPASQPRGLAAALVTLQHTHGNQHVQRLLSGMAIQRKCDCGGTCSNCGTERQPGDRGVDRLLRSGLVQTKLTISEPRDQYEQEADRVAEQVMRMSAPVASDDALTAVQPPNISRYVRLTAAKDIARQFAEEKQEIPMPEKEFSEADLLSLKEIPGASREMSPGLETQIQSLHGGGQPLAADLRSFFEPRFGYDFSGVRVHTDSRAAQTAQVLNARAYTLGRDVAFAPGEYQPETPEGRRLLAHELTHTIQQSSSSGAQIQRAVRFTGSFSNISLTSQAAAAIYGDDFTYQDASFSADAGEFGEASSSLASPRFGHDFSRIPVNDSQVRARAAPREPASLRSCDMEGSNGVEGMGLMDRDGLEFRRGPSLTDPAPTHALGGTLPYREATELLECVRIMGEGNAAYCRQEVLGEAPPGPLSVTVPDHVRSASTPTGMPDRIPPRVNTPAAVDLSGWEATMPPVTFSVRGARGANGRVTINGANSVDLTASATVQLRGVDQTAPGSAGGLRLVATQGPRVLASSQGFSVSSIPQNWSITFDSLITGARRGIRVNNNWESDSGNVADLDQAERSEQVQYGAGSGSLAGAGAGAQNSGYLPANTPPLRDSHGASVALLTSVGSITAEQTFIFKDHRTGATDIPAKRSGYRLTRDVTEPTPGNREIETTKAGTATTANGFSSSAGSGTVSRRQAV